MSKNGKKTSRRHSLTRKLFSWLMVLCMVFSTGAFTVQTANAATGGTPTHTKNVTDNQDGTYTISLDIVGESEKKPNNVNVIVIFDRSGSMGQPNNWQGQPTNGRLNAAKTAVNNLASSLFAYNTTDAPNTVQMALVDFSTTATSRTPTNSYATFSGQVNGLSASGGTNWEDALQDAANVDFGDDDQTFVIFVSDGNPTFRNTRGNYNPMDDAYYGNPYNYGVYGNGSDSQAVGGISAATTISRCYDHAVDDAQALVDSVGGDHFFTIGAYGNVDRMEDLTDDAGSDSSTNYYSAADTTALNQAMSDILAKIETMGFAQAEVDDGTTNQVTTSSSDVAELLELVPNFKYYRSGGSYGSSMQTWTDAPEAKVVDGEVVWDLSSVGVLENGVKYTVTFDCYPSQTTYDIIAQLKNGDIQYSDLDSEIQKYIVDNGNGSYSLRTNTNAGIKWDDTRDDEGRQESSYVNPDPVKTDAETLTATKEWEGGDPDVDELEITVLMDDKPFHSDTISKNNNWSTESFISIGIIKNGQALPGAEGHDFKFAELGDEQYHWELESPVVRPMLVDGTRTMLVLIDDKHPAPSGAATYTINGKEYYADTSAAGLTAINHRRSNLNLTKVVTGEDAPADATFPFTLQVNNPKAPSAEPTNDPNHDSDYWLWFSIYDTNAGATVTDATVSGTDLVGPNADGYYYLPSKNAVTVQMKDGWNLRFLNLPSGTTYTFTEGTLPDGFAFNKSELTQGTDTTFSGAQTTTGTIQNTKTSYTVKYTNDYALTDLEITKIWKDNSNRDETRPSVEDFKALLTLSPAVEGAEPTVVDNGDDTFTITYSDLPRFNNGEEVEYTVTEGTLGGYDTEGSPAKDHGKITNSFDPDPISAEFDVIKVLDVPAGLTGPDEWEYTFTATPQGSAPAPTENEITVDQDNATANFEFAEGAFTAPGTYEYVITESGEVEGVTNDADATSGKTVTIEVTFDKESGQLVAEVTGADEGGESTTFTNTYGITQGDTVDPPVKKVLEGADIDDFEGQFTFKIEGVSAPDGVTDIPMPENTTITNSDTYAKDVEGETFYEFGEIEYTVPGTYTYTITEEAGSLGYITYDEQEYTMTVTVVDNHDGTVTATMDPAAGAMVFINEYTATGSATLEATKVLDGRDWKDGETFEFTCTDEDGNVVGDPQSVSKDDPEASWTVDYTLEDVGEHTYTISETSELPGGVTKSADIEATVEVSDNSTGKLTTTVTYKDGNNTITNTYKPEPVKTQFNVDKTVTFINDPDNYNTALDREFEFTLAAVNPTDAPLPENTTKTITTENGKGSVSFGDIEFKTPGTYEYKVTETATSDKGWTYDSKTHKIVVEVEDDLNGNLVVKGKTYEEDEAATSVDIQNEYEEASTEVVLDLTKTIDDQSGSHPEKTFTFQLLDEAGEVVEEKTITITADELIGNVKFSPIEFTKAGTHNYTLKEIAEEQTEEGPWTYDTKEYPVVITISNDFEEAQLKNGVTIDGKETTALNITNTYKAAETNTTLEVTKEIEDTSGSAYESTFTFDLTGPAGYTDSVSITGAGTAAFEPINFKKVGEYKYTIKETAGDAAGYKYDSGQYEVIITVVDENGKLVATKEVKDKTGQSKTEISFTNKYDPKDATIVLNAKKIVEDKTGGASGKTFKFELLDADGNVIATATRKGGGPVSFDELSYSKVGTYNYTIREVAGSDKGYTYDTNEYPVTVEVTDEGEGKLVAKVTGGKDVVITNTYEAEPVTLTIEATKVLTGRDLEDGEFTFQLKKGDEVVAEATNDADGKIVFDELTFEKAGKYKYLMLEVIGDEENMTYDTNVYPVTVEVTDDGEGELKAECKDEITFNNKYKEPPVPPEPKPEPTPKTGDDSMDTVAILVLFASATLLGLLRARRRSNER